MLISNSQESVAQVRQSEILRALKTNGGAASIAEIADRFGVSGMTVRRALRKLADAGLVIRTPGGAMATPSSSLEKSFLDRAQKNAGAKDAIGQAAADLSRRVRRSSSTREPRPGTSPATLRPARESQWSRHHSRSWTNWRDAKASACI
jgi:DNA-binding FadR family transcriptional regulator